MVTTGDAAAANVAASKASSDVPVLAGAQHP